MLSELTQMSDEEYQNMGKGEICPSVDIPVSPAHVFTQIKYETNM